MSGVSAFETGAAWDDHRKTGENRDRGGQRGLLIEKHDHLPEGMRGQRDGQPCRPVASIEADEALATMEAGVHSLQTAGKESSFAAAWTGEYAPLSNVFVRVGASVM